jgi:hypothetical protein
MNKESWGGHSHTIPQIEAMYYGAVFLRVGWRRARPTCRAVVTRQTHLMYVYRDKTGQNWHHAVYFSRPNYDNDGCPPRLVINKRLPHRHPASVQEEQNLRVSLYIKSFCVDGTYTICMSMYPTRRGINEGEQRTEAVKSTIGVDRSATE